jgi:hypothetical protein
MVDKLDANSLVVHFFWLVCRCESADPAALLEAALVRPSRSTCDALDAAADEVTLLGAATCASALAAAVFEFLPVELFAKTCDALWAAFVPVTLLFMVYPQSGSPIEHEPMASITQSSD